MREKIKIDLEQQIESSSHLQREEKTVMHALFSTLAEEQQRLFDILLERTVEEVYPNRASVQSQEMNHAIVTCLLPSSQKEWASQEHLVPILEESETFFPVKEQILLSDLGDILEGEPLYSGFGFLHCSYDKMDEMFDRPLQGRYEDKDGQWHPVSYHLSKESGYLETEKMLFESFAQNNRKEPPIFSPMSRRAVNVFLHIQECETQPERIDFQWKENGLEEILVTDSLLFWNLSATDSDKLPALQEVDPQKVLPLFDEMYHIYPVSVSDNEFLWISQKSAVMKRDHENLYLGVEDTSALEYKKLRVHLVAEAEKVRLFENVFEKSRVEKERVVTLWDISFIVAQFSPLGLKLEGVSLQKSKLETLKPYSQDDLYPYSRDKFYRKGTGLFLQFAEAEDDMFFLDKVAYVLQYIQHFYPEFHYIGGKL